MPKKEKERKKLKGKTRNVGKRRMKEHNKGMEEEKEGRTKIREETEKKDEMIQISLSDEENKRKI